jgi:hypothetical protein
MFITLISSGNGSKVKPDPLHGEFEAAHSRPPVTEVKQSSNRQNGEMSAATRRPPSMQLAHIINIGKGEFEAAHSRRTCKNGGFVVQ